MNAPDFSPHLLPRPEVSQPAASPKPAASTSLGKGQVDRDRPRVDRDGPYKGKNSKGGKGKGKTKGGSVSMPLPLRGMNAKTKDGKPKCFDFNLQHGCQHKDTDCPKGHHSCMNGVVAMPSTRFRPATPSLRNPGGLDYPPQDESAAATSMHANSEPEKPGSNSDFTLSNSSASPIPIP